MKIKKLLTYVLFVLLVPAVVVGGSLIFNDKQYAFTIIAVAIISMIPFIIHFEHNETDLERIVIIAVMTALSVAGRFVFEWLPHFKPVTAIVVICGMYLGAEAGFLCGAFSALISNFIFGQGPWTPFQMFSWGIIGLFAALFSKYLSKNKIILSLFGIFSGIIYSLFLDVWTVFWSDGFFNVKKYLSLLVSAIPVTVVYAVSNVVFLLLLYKPVGKKLERLKTKYGI